MLKLDWMHARIEIERCGKSLYYSNYLPYFLENCNVSSKQHTHAYTFIGNKRNDYVTLVSKFLPNIFVFYEEKKEHRMYE